MSNNTAKNPEADVVLGHVESEEVKDIFAPLDKFDKLDKLFEKQRLLQLRFHDEVPDVATDIQYVKDMTLALLDEVLEAIRETPWKPWKKSALLHRVSFQEELVDAWHFLINLTLASGMDAEDLYERFCHKNDINHERQDGDY